MKLELFPTTAGIWALNLGGSFDHFLCKELLRLHEQMKTGSEIWDRKPHDIFDGSVRLEFLTGLIPVHIEGEFRSDRKDIFGLSDQPVTPQEIKAKPFPIPVVSA